MSACGSRRQLPEPEDSNIVVGKELDKNLTCPNCKDHDASAGGGLAYFVATCAQRGFVA